MKDGKLSRSEAGRIGWEKSKDSLESALKARIFSYDASPKLCEGCGQKLPYKKRSNRFCSQSCFASKNNLGKRRHGAEPGNCLKCGIRLTRSDSRWCSSECHNTWENETYIEKWLKGEEDGGIGKHKEGVSKLVRRWVLRESGGICSVCGGKEWLGKAIPLLLDHIDGNSRNNRPENLRMVCGNCDMQLSTYKGRNKGKGRFSRRERYANGQSY